ncbi:MAG: Caudovirus prohead protease [Planctomycetes bacterium ADurb.Bin126]|mgnify:CR=1 FL=1|nr:MAG: Caudovirus prohead protease [Planctomycetes bacterium ADurb.Bin126]HOD79963.1 hypothetical protein [Phycisphaerae bacterium]HQL74020.1 hypothetical protein [Phycisphaerae bacterium]
MLNEKTIDKGDERARDRFIKGFTQGGKAIDLASRTVGGIASTISIDRDGEIVLPSSFARRLDGFLKSNVPFAAAHLHRTNDGGPTQIGWVKSLSVQGDSVHATFQFATTDLAEQWWKLAADPNGKGIAFSIGFIPRQYVRGTAAELSGKYPEISGAIKEGELADSDPLLVYTDIELLEISAVMVPSNRRAMQQLAAKLFASGHDGKDGPDDQAVAVEKAVRELAAPIVKQAVDQALAAQEEKYDELFAGFVSEMDDLKALLPGYLRSDAGECEADGTCPDRRRQAGAGVGSGSQQPQPWQRLKDAAARLAGSAG